MDHVSRRSAENRPKKMRLGPIGSKPKRPGFQVWTNSTLGGPDLGGPDLGGPGYGKGKLLTRLEAENAELRDKAVELLLQIQAMRDGDHRALTA